MLVQAIRGLPAWTEKTIVVFGAFGMFILSSLLADNDGSPTILTNEGISGLAIYEIVVATVLMSVLIIRGWHSSDLGFVAPSFEDIWHPALLVGAAVGIDTAIWFSLVPLGIQTANEIVTVDSNVGAANALVLSIINGAFEETFVCAYIVTAWRSSGVGVAVGISTAVRLSYHLYQGAYAIATIVPLGMIFAWYFWSRRRVVPLIVGHAALDLAALFMLSH